MRHRIPNGDPAAILERALQVLVEKVEKERLGKTARPHREARSSKPGHIAASVRREVFERDGEQCTYVDGEGRRCECKTLLELDHITPRALGGPDDAANLRIRCRPHNRMYAEQVFGKDFVAERIHSRQRQAQRVKQAPLMTQRDASSAREVERHEATRSVSFASADTIDRATRGLVNMGFARSDVSKTLDKLAHRHRSAASPPALPALLREAIAVLT